MAYREPDAEPLLERKLISKEPPEIRAGFIAKVYGILTAQLLLTAALAAPFVLSAGVKHFVDTKGLPLVLGMTVVNISFMCAMMCPCGCERNMRKFPLNYILLGGFTASEGVLVGVCCAHYKIEAVLLAVVCTSVLVGGLTCYAMLTKRDFTGFGPYLFAAVLSLMFFGIFAAIFQNQWMRNLYCCLGILLFSFYLIFDTQLIIGKGEHSLSVDDYIFGALQLYIDIIQIFLYILQLLGDRN